MAIRGAPIHFFLVANGFQYLEFGYLLIPILSHDQSLFSLFFLLLLLVVVVVLRLRLYEGESDPGFGFGILLHDINAEISCNDSDHLYESPSKMSCL